MCRIWGRSQLGSNWYVREQTRPRPIRMQHLSYLICVCSGLAFFGTGVCYLSVSTAVLAVAVVSC